MIAVHSLNFAMIQIASTPTLNSEQYFETEIMLILRHCKRGVKRHLYYCFLDISKAFDKINRQIYLIGYGRREFVGDCGDR